MAKAILRFYEELNRFLPEDRRKIDTELDLHDRKSVKDMIEAEGVPPAEIDLILVNGKSVDFNHIVRGGERISVYPVFESLNIENVTRLRKIPLRKTRFIADTGLEDVVRLIRILGFDVYFDASLPICRQIQISRAEHRVLLTKRKGFIRSEGVTHAIPIHPGSARDQVQKILDVLDLRSSARPFSRCVACNEVLVRIPRTHILDGIASKTRTRRNLHAYCKTCDKIYCHETYFSRLKNAADDLLKPRKTQNTPHKCQRI